MNPALRKRINTYLGNRGLAQLDDPGLFAQLAYLVRDHDHLRSLLVAAEPDQRCAMYDALASSLRFKPRTLEEYLIEARQDAEARQLPWIAEDGTLKQYLPPEAHSDSAEMEFLEAAISEAVAKERLDVVCRKCTRAASFYGTDKWEAVQAARDAGWAYSWIDGQGFEICPVCEVGREAFR